MNGTKEITLKLETVTEQAESSTAPALTVQTSLPSQSGEISHALDVETVMEQEGATIMPMFLTEPLFAAHTSLPSSYCEICNLLAS